MRSTGATTIGRVDDRYMIGAWIALSAMLALAFVVVHARLGLRAVTMAARRVARQRRCDSRRASGRRRSDYCVRRSLCRHGCSGVRTPSSGWRWHTNRRTGRARDPQLLGAAWIALILFPWNPALWLMVSRLRLAIEVDCDRRVLRGGASPSAYGSLLVAVAELASPLRPSALALADDSSHLRTRILAMDAHLPKFGRIRAGLATLIGAIAVLAACEAKEPTAADVDSMTAASAEKAAQRNRRAARHRHRRRLRRRQRTRVAGNGASHRKRRDLDDEGPA